MPTSGDKHDAMKRWEMTTSDKAALLALADKLETLPKVQTGDPEHPRANEPEHIPPHGSSEHMSDESSARDILEYHLHNGEAGPTRFNMDQHLHHDVGGMPAFALATVGWPGHTTDHQNEEVWRHSDTLRSLAQERLGLDDDTAAALFDGPNHAGRQRRFIEPTQAAQACRLAADGASPEDLWPTVDREAIHSLSELENKWTYHDEHIREMAEQDRLEAIEASPGRSTDPDDDKGPDEADLAEVQGFDWSTETTVALDAKIHPTADIGRVTRIAKHCEIAAGAIIHDGVDLPTSVKVGERSELGHGTGIGKNTAIGNDCAFDACTVGANVTIGSNVNVELGAVIGDHAVIADNAKIRTRSSIPAYANVEAFAEIAATDKVEADERNHVADTAEVHESSKLGARTHVRGTSKIENGVQTIREVSITDSTVQANTLIGSQVDVERSKIGPLAVVGNNTTITDSEIRKGGIQPGVRINKSTIEAGYELSRNSSVSRSTIGPDAVGTRLPDNRGQQHRQKLPHPGRTPKNKHRRQHDRTGREDRGQPDKAVDNRRPRNHREPHDRHEPASHQNHRLQDRFRHDSRKRSHRNNEIRDRTGLQDRGIDLQLQHREGRPDQAGNRSPLLGDRRRRDDRRAVLHRPRDDARERGRHPGRRQDKQQSHDRARLRNRQGRRHRLRHDGTPQHPDPGRRGLPRKSHDHR